jgi:hypothetical protein
MKTTLSHGYGRLLLADGDDQGGLTDHTGLLLHFSNFAHKGLVQDVIARKDQD